MNVGSTTTHEYLLIVEALSCERGDRILFDNLDFTLKNGQGLHIAGANGSGKTSLIRIIAGLATPQTGAIRWSGKKIQQIWQNYAANSCFVGHQSGINKQLSPRENCRFLLQLQQIKASDDDINQALEQVELFGFEDELAGTLSAGQQRRIALAQLLLCRAPLWLLDEPYTALDKLGIDILDSLCEQHLAQNGLLIFASHQASALDQHAHVQQILLKN